MFVIEQPPIISKMKRRHINKTDFFFFKPNKEIEIERHFGFLCSIVHQWLVILCKVKYSNNWIVILLLNKWIASKASSGPFCG